MKKLFVVVLLIVGFVIVIVAARDIIVKASVEKGVELVTGLKLEIGSVQMGILKPVAHIKDLKLFNPKDFPDRIMVDLSEIYVHYNLPAILKGKIYLPEVRLALKEFVVVKNSRGELNLDALRSIQAQKKDKPIEPKTADKAPDMKIDELHLNIGSVFYKDYSKGSKPEIREFKVNLHEVYRDIDDPNTLANLIIARALRGTPIASLANFNLKGLQGSMTGVLSGVQKAVTSTVSTVTGTVTETGKQAVDAVKGLIKSPFGADH